MAFGIPHFKKPQWVWTDIDIPGLRILKLAHPKRTEGLAPDKAGFCRDGIPAPCTSCRHWNHRQKQSSKPTRSTRHSIISHHISSYRNISHHISSHLIISPHIASYLIISHHISSYLIISHHIASYRIISHHISAYPHVSSCPHISSYLSISHHISSRLIIYPHISSYLLIYPHLLISHHTSSYLLISHQISSYRSISHHISSYLLISHHISSYLIISPHISSYLLIYPHISSYLIISQHISHLSWFLRFTHPRPELVSWQLFWPKVHKFVATDLEANDPSHFKKALKQHTAPLFKWHSCDFHVPHPTPEYAAKEVRWGAKPLKSLK
jgi:hypothetical protein